MTEKRRGEEVRINRYLAMCGIASRRAADQMVIEGRVMVNGQVVIEPGLQIKMGKDEVIVDGQKYALPEERKVYILFNKPRNVITTSSDERDREMVLDYIKVKERVFPVGRLDRKTTGVLLFTNDGILANKLMHPSSNVKKEYLAVLDTAFPQSSLPLLTGGMRLKDTGEKVRPCQAKILDGGMQVWMSLHEGKNHQVRRMFWTLGFEVTRLERVTYAGLKTGDLRRGEWRYLNREEVRQLQELAGSS
ncbi:rRNA pseudouridine synthase [Chlorobium phaeovibrioides]|uniref:Pseudouridine synthase n=1 Tax=Chlorobium phaeovibrioides TaxID=1094 RepID=A0A3S0NJQ8_CHLPH|nr:pseudouridine synthase [Chlorobium phaeovibrioides]KAA6233086.1 rRNA pseudouridine synthase [Chlorobium phaeovibrioides]MWV53674.1 pseudouridine synthase [Chlorobium phaeovibrioides]QEQ56523.1 rRNA pseudouridine synthase [Chlorobium phaeovibrioides]RTY35809.1 rRNA pseudouridine synthase [Chlorobium phaeovibrioides]RTY39121.1 rRNA pseudouridine synthase [Chlorobium phaeovibrioides]